MILNAAVLVFSSLMFACAEDCAYRIHSKWLPIPREVFNVAIYSFLGLYKILVITFNLIPYLALSAIG